MPIADYECKCGRTTEYIRVGRLPDTIRCECGGTAEKIITMTGVHCGNSERGFYRDALEVVDKENPSRHVQEFVKDPKKDTWKRWMKGEGIRPMSEGEGGRRPTEKDRKAKHEAVTHVLAKKQVERNRITIGN